MRVSNVKLSLLGLDSDQLIAAIKFMIEFIYDCGRGKSRQPLKLTAAYNTVNGSVGTEITVLPWHLSPRKSPGMCGHVNCKEVKELRIAPRVFSSKIISHNPTPSVDVLERFS